MIARVREVLHVDLMPFRTVFNAHYFEAAAALLQEGVDEEWQGKPPIC
jgi:hypothetical protein